MLNITGLFLNFLGTIVATFSIGSWKHSYSTEVNTTDDGKTHVAPPRAYVNPRLAKIGLGLIVIGFFFQLVAGFN